jgi:hypothetical protein
MTKTYLEWVDAKLTEHEREIAKLTITREMLLLAGKDLDRQRGGSPHLKSLPKPDKRKRGGQRGPVAEQTRAAMRSIGKPAAMATIHSEVQARNPEALRKAVTNALYNMVVRGDIIFDRQTKLYTLVVRQEPAAEPPPQMPAANAG